MTHPTDIYFGIDIGTTSVAGVAVDGGGELITSISQAHDADVRALPEGVFEQDALRLLSATQAILAELTSTCGRPASIGWTGQMHGVVGVDKEMRPVTNLVTWRDARRYGGRIMSGWYAHGIQIDRCVPVCALALSAPITDMTFLHSWYLDEPGLSFPRAWLPEVVAGCMLGDNQAGVYAAQRLLPGSAVVNLGTSGQLSVVRERPFNERALPGTATGESSRRECRPYPGGRTLECRASMLGGALWASTREKLGLSWEEMNRPDNPRAISCAARIVNDLFEGIDLSGVSAITCVGNALVKNPALVRALEARSGLACHIPALPEMAACGAAFFAADRFQD